MVNDSKLEIAKNLIEEGMSYEQIAKVTGLPMEEIQKLANNDVA
jgi:predicted transposase YdaD